ncbi:UNVERIFIED_CONTAM: Protein-tyrosine-phosphatase MKP1 [Sesamum radiatum]|uniref:Protein-tyrosine-phosphatase MKP1 n=1 Tax=Sesamum radiatum TaxID=300843 RepID=A0AAW2MXG3_SESRA
MIREEEKDQAPGGSWKTYSRSVSWTERPPRKSASKPQWNSKARACLPPLQPLSIIRPSIEEWPRAGSDDLGVWPNPPTPGAKPGSITPQYFKKELVYKTLWLQDCPSEDITSILYDVFDYFEDVREQGGRVLVHCCQGVSRSTSLVIAYLMWKEGQSFDDAFQHVKAARGVTNPNVGFACQLLQCQKRVHALPASPTSVLRMYRMAPHSPYDPLHLVPKMLCEPGADKLDSRGAFIIHIPSALYIWTGKHCSQVMSDNAKAAASQVIRYERAQGPVITVKEGEETFEFWDALSYRKSSAGVCEVNSEEGKSSLAVSDLVLSTVHPCPNQRKLAEYDLDFEIFHRALSGGVVPPFPLPGEGSETCLPARESGWNRLRRKFADGIVKEFITSSKLSSSASQKRDGLEKMDTCKEGEDFSSPANLSMPSSDQCDSPDSLASYLTSSPGRTKNNFKEVGYPASLSEASLSRSPSFSLVDSFPSCLVNKPKSNSTSPSLSPSTSDYSSSFTFSPSSSNWSDLSFVSAQPSPYGLESGDIDPAKSGLLEESVCSADESTHLLDNEISPPAENAISADLSSKVGWCSTSGDTSPSPVEHRGSNIPHQMSLVPTDEASQISEKLTRYLEGGMMRPAECNNFRWRNVSSKSSCRQLIRNGSNCEDRHADMEAVDRDLFVKKGFSMDAEIKIVKEGEEPALLLKHLARNKSGKDLENGVK